VWAEIKRFFVSFVHFKHIHPTPLFQTSPPRQSGLLCYPDCAAGYTGVGPVCWQQCRPGFTDEGALCGKGGSIVPADTSACPWYGAVSFFWGPHSTRKDHIAMSIRMRTLVSSFVYIILSDFQPNQF
jgi:hypothetical protein